MTVAVRMQGPPLRNWITSGLLAFALVVALGFAPDTMGVELRGNPGAAAATDIVITRPEVEMPLRLDNDSATNVELTLLVRALRVSGAASACNESAGCTVAVYLVGPAGEEKLTGAERKIQIPARGSQALVLRGKAPAIGRYVVDVVLDEKGQVTTKSVAFRRDVRELHQGALTLGPVGQLPMASNGTTPPFAVHVQAGGEELHLDRLELSLLRADASGAFTQPVAWPELALSCLPEAKSDKAGGKPEGMHVAAGGTLSCTTQLPQWTRSGVYRVSVEAIGYAIKSQKAQADVRVRSPWWFAFLALLVGSLSGALIASWNRDGRARLLLAIKAQEVREQYIAFDADLTHGGQRTSAFVEQRKVQLAHIVESLRTGTSPAGYVDKVERLRDLLPLIGRFYSLERDFGNATAQSPLYGPTVDELAKDDPDLAACRTRLEALETALRNAAAAQRGEEPADTAAPLFFFSWGRSISADALGRLLSRNDRRLALLSMLVAVLTGLVALWSNDPDWGSLGDWLVAFLAGLGITVGGTVSLQQLAQNYQLGSLARRG